MIKWFVISILCVIFLASCAAGPNPNKDTMRENGKNPAGFWLGLWHGFIAIFGFIVSLFKTSVGIYETHNNGFWYNFGFIIGLITSHGGGAGLIFQGRKK